MFQVSTCIALWRFILGLALEMDTIASPFLPPLNKRAGYASLIHGSWAVLISSLMEGFPDTEASKEFVVGQIPIAKFVRIITQVSTLILFMYHFFYQGGDTVPTHRQ